MCHEVAIVLSMNNDRREKCVAAIQRRKQMGDEAMVRTLKAELLVIDAASEEQLGLNIHVDPALMPPVSMDDLREAASTDAMPVAKGQWTQPKTYTTIHYNTEAEWKADHRFMSGSRVAKVVGLSKWGGPLAAYLECTDPQDIEDNEPMKAGRYLEEGVAKWACEDYELGECRMNGRSVVVHGDYPFIRATPDAWTDEGGLEIKTSSDRHGAWPATNGELLTFKPEEDPGLPSDVWCQVLLTMAITGQPHWYVGVLRWGTDLRVYKVPASPEIQDWLVSEAVKFWTEHVETERAPQPTEADAQPYDSGLITQRLFPSEDKGTTLEVDDDLTTMWARNWVEASAIENKAKVSKELAALQLSQHMADSETMLVQGNKYTWKTNKWGNRTFRGPTKWKAEENES